MMVAGEVAVERLAVGVTVRTQQLAARTTAQLTAMATPRREHQTGAQSTRAGALLLEQPCRVTPTPSTDIGVVRTAGPGCGGDCEAGALEVLGGPPTSGGLGV